MRHYSFIPGARLLARSGAAERAKRQMKSRARLDQTAYAPFQAPLRFRSFPIQVGRIFATASEGMKTHVCLAEVKCPGCFVSRASLTENFHPIGGLVFTLYSRLSCLLPVLSKVEVGSNFRPRFGPVKWQATIFRANTCLSVDVNWI